MMSPTTIEEREYMNSRALC